MRSLAHTLPSTSSISSPFAGHTSALFPAMVEAALSAIPGSSSTPTSPRSAGAHTAVFHSYVTSNSPVSDENSTPKTEYLRNETDKRQAHEHHRAHLESLPADQLSYPLGPKGNAAEVNEAQKVTDEPLAQR